MKENLVKIVLVDFTESAHPFGNRKGREVYQKLLDVVEDHPATSIFVISLKGIKATDASFPRESVVSIAKQFRGEKGFFLTDFNSRDLIDNWSYAAKAKEQPLIIWYDHSHEIIGPDITSSTKDLVEYVIEKGKVTTSKVADDLNLSVQNASTKLKNLVKQGFVLRSEEIADTGGVEFKYHSIH